MFLYKHPEKAETCWVLQQTIFDSHSIYWIVINLNPTIVLEDELFLAKGLVTHNTVVIDLTLKI